MRNPISQTADLFRTWVTRKKTLSGLIEDSCAIQDVLPEPTPERLMAEHDVHLKVKSLDKKLRLLRNGVTIAATTIAVSAYALVWLLNAPNLTFLCVAIGFWRTMAHIGPNKFNRKLELWCNTGGNHLNVLARGITPADVIKSPKRDEVLKNFPSIREKFNESSEYQSYLQELEGKKIVSEINAGTSAGKLPILKPLRLIRPRATP